MSRHYQAIQPDTPANYVLDVDGFVFHCPHCQKYGFVVEEGAVGTCEKHGPMLPFNASAGFSFYARHWMTMTEVRFSFARQKRDGILPGTKIVSREA